MTQKMSLRPWLRPCRSNWGACGRPLLGSSSF